MNDTDDVDENAGVSVQQFVVFFLKINTTATILFIIIFTIKKRISWFIYLLIA